MPKALAREPLTDRELRALRPAAPGQRKELVDGDPRNLLVRVTPSGKISFALLVRPNRGGNPTRRFLGEYGQVSGDGKFSPAKSQNALTLKDARDRAKVWNTKFSNGVDPRDEARAAAEHRLAETQPGTTRFAEVVEQYLAKRVIGPDPAKPLKRRGHELRRQLEHVFVTVWGTRPIASITADDIEDLLVAKSETSPAMARNLFAALRALMNWASRRREYRPLTNPCLNVDGRELFGAKPNRERVLDHDELRLLARNVRRLPYPFGPLYQLLVLTGLRLNEAARAQWSEFDFENLLWEIPSARMKGNRPHVVPLTPGILALIKTIPRSKHARFVFSTTGGDAPVSGFSKVKARMAARMLRSLRALARQRRDHRPVAIQRWVNHDLRRTFRTQLSALPAISHDTRESLLSHAKPGVHGTYDRYQHLAEKRTALELWAARLNTILTFPLGDLEKFRPK